MSDACRRSFDAILVWKIDRFGRSLKHLGNSLAELAALGVAFVSLRDNLDLSTASGRLIAKARRRGRLQTRQRRFSGPRFGVLLAVSAKAGVIDARRHRSSASLPVNVGSLKQGNAQFIKVRFE